MLISTDSRDFYKILVLIVSSYNHRNIRVGKTSPQPSLQSMILFLMISQTHVILNEGTSHNNIIKCAS